MCGNFSNFVPNVPLPLNVAAGLLCISVMNLRLKTNIYRIPSLLRKAILPVALTLLGIAAAPGAYAKADDFVVVIDAGHGGHDVGAIDNGAREKDINLGTALQLGKLIEKNLKDVKVVYTRDDDTFVSLQGRADIANKNKGNLFVSIHTNSVDKSNKNRTSVQGSSVYTLGLHKDAANMAVARRENSVISLEDDYEQKYQGFDPNSDESYIIFEMAQRMNLAKSNEFAGDVVRNLAADAGRKNRGVHQAGFWVLWATSMPAVLIELDFICNPDQAAFISSTDGQKKMANAIYKAVKDYVARERGGRKSASKAPAKPSSEPSAEPASQPDANPAAQLSSGPVALPASRTSSRLVSHVSKETPRTPVARKRRPESAKQISDKRNFETASIPLHSEAERLAKPIAEPKPEQTLAAAPADKDKGKKAGKKGKSAKDKAKDKDKDKDKKKSAKAAKPQTRVVGGKTVTLSQGEAPAPAPQHKPGQRRSRNSQRRLK